MPRNEIPDPPWKRATQKRRSQRSERQGAKTDGGRTVAMSGAGREKGDYRANGWRIEDKYTDAKSFSLKAEDFAKIEREALMTPPGLLPQMRITMPGHKLRVLREQDYLYLEALAGGNRE